MHIVSAADEEYVPHFCAMLHSAWLFHPEAAYTLLAQNVAGESMQLLRDFSRARNISLRILPVDAKLTAGLPLPPGISSATYCRFYLAEMLPASVERVLYLDADITLNGRLDDLFAMDMRGLPLAAALDLDTTVALEREVRDLPDDFQYFNAGVLLADLSVWRQEAIGDQLLAFAKAAAKLPFSDQSTINLVLQRRILPLERALNFISMDFIASVPDPIVIHHAGWLKPWRAPWSAFHDLYRFHRSQTPWPLPETSHVGLMLKKGRRRAAAILGIPRYRKLAEEMRVHEAARRSVGLPALQRARDLLARASFTGQGMA